MRCRPGWILLCLFGLLGPSDSMADNLSANHVVFLKALHSVEGSGRIRPPDGDGGQAIGPFQIHHRYWRDAVRQQPALRTAGYQHCRDYSYAVQVVCAYLNRYAPQAWAAGDWEKAARIHNGGPDGWKQRATLAYWRKVQAALITSSPSSPDLRR